MPIEHYPASPTTNRAVQQRSRWRGAFIGRGRRRLAEHRAEYDPHRLRGPYSARPQPVVRQDETPAPCTHSGDLRGSTAHVTRHNAHEDAASPPERGGPHCAQRSKLVEDGVRRRTYSLPHRSVCRFHVRRARGPPDEGSVLAAPEQVPTAEIINILPLPAGRANEVHRPEIRLQSSPPSADNMSKVPRRSPPRWTWR